MKPEELVVGETYLFPHGPYWQEKIYVGQLPEVPRPTGCGDNWFGWFSTPEEMLIRLEHQSWVEMLRRLPV